MTAEFDPVVQTMLSRKDEADGCGTKGIRDATMQTDEDEESSAPSPSEEEEDEWEGGDDGFWM